MECSCKSVSKLSAFLETVSNLFNFLETHGHPTPTKARNVSGHPPDLSADKAPLMDYSHANLTHQKVIWLFGYLVIFLFLSRACTLLYIYYILGIYYIYNI